MLTHHLAEHYFQPKIDLIEHLIQYSQNILLVTAKKGGGKTAFAHFCLAHKSPQLKKHLLSITPDISIENMMENIAKGFGMSWPQTGVASSDAVQKIWTLWIDDAQLLSLDKLEALIRLVNFHQEPRRQLHLVLLGDDKLVGQFLGHRITQLVGSYSTIIELDLPLDLRLDWQKDSQKESQIRKPTPVKASEFDSLEINTKGISETKADIERDIDIDRDIDLLEDFPDDGFDPPSSSFSSSFLQVFSHPVAYGLYLGVIVGISLWTWQGRGEAPPVLSVEAIASEQMPLELAIEAPIESPVEPPIESPMPLATEAIFVPPVTKPAVQKLTEKKARHKNTITKQANIAEPILTKNKSHYTLQLYGSNEPQKVLNFKQTHGLEKAWVVKKKHQGKTWHVLVMGDYATKIQAKKATEHLPLSLYQAKVTPWVRDFSSVQAEIVQ